MNNRITFVTGLLSGAVLLLATAPALARADVSLNIGVPGYYVQPSPVYVQPQPVYVQPRPVYVQPRPVYVQQPGYYVDHQHRQDWHQRHWNNGRHRGHDRDHDGIPNRYDRDIDGDGVPNRYDRRPNNPYRN